MIVWISLALPLAAQTLVVDRPLGDQPPMAQPVERGAKGGYADSFRIGASGEVWMIDAIRVWAIPDSSPECPREIGDRFEKITLFGALDNPPVPGQPVCDCHALVAIATAPLLPGGDATSNPSVRLAAEKRALRLDFHDVRWSVPGNSDVLFSVRATPRRKDAAPKACSAAGWRLAAAPAAPDYRLHLLDAKGIPAGLEELRSSPRMVHIQVWAQRTR